MSKSSCDLNSRNSTSCRGFACVFHLSGMSVTECPFQPEKLGLFLNCRSGIKRVSRGSPSHHQRNARRHTHTCVCTYICINPVLYHKEKVNILSLSVPRNKLGGFCFVLLSLFVFQQRFPTSISNQWATPNGLKDSLVLCQQVFYSVPEWRLL